MLGEEVYSGRKSGSMGKGLRGSANRVSVFVSFESINEIIMKCRVCNATHVPNVVSPSGLTMHGDSAMFKLSFIRNQSVIFTFMKCSQSGH